MCLNSADCVKKGAFGLDDAVFDELMQRALDRFADQWEAVFCVPGNM
jgi:hypothetical protein